MDLIYDSLELIFENNGFEKELAKLSAACNKLQGDILSYQKSEPMVNSQNIIKSMAIVHAIIEGFMVSRNRIYKEVEDHKKDYIENELNKLGIEMPVLSYEYASEMKGIFDELPTTNRVAKFFKDGYNS